MSELDPSLRDRFARELGSVAAPSPRRPEPTTASPRVSSVPAVALALVVLVGTVLVGSAIRGLRATPTSVGSGGEATASSESWRVFTQAPPIEGVPVTVFFERRGVPAQTQELSFQATCTSCVGDPSSSVSGKASLRAASACAPALASGGADTQCFVANLTFPRAGSWHIGPPVDGEIVVGPKVTPAGFALPPGCSYVREAGIPSGTRYLWQIDCGSDADRGVQMMRTALTTQGWMTCTSSVETSTWVKDRFALTVARITRSPLLELAQSPRETVQCSP
jgi:hypothetical protein